MDTQQAILDAGRREFLEKGFQDASVRQIAARAGVTTGAMYGYYADKAALFEALVEPAASTFRDRFASVQSAFAALPPQAQIDSMFHYSSGALQALLDFVYANQDAFRLLVSHAAGTAYAHYFDTLVDIEAESTRAYMEVLRREGHSVAPLSDNLVHILASAYFSAIFQTVAHDMDKAEADAYVHQLTSFFQAGWRTLLQDEPCP